MFIHPYHKLKHEFWFHFTTRMMTSKHMHPTTICWTGYVRIYATAVNSSSILYAILLSDFLHLFLLLLLRLRPPQVPADLVSEPVDLIHIGIIRSTDSGTTSDYGACPSFTHAAVSDKLVCLHVEVGRGVISRPLMLEGPKYRSRRGRKNWLWMLGPIGSH